MHKRLKIMNRITVPILIYIVLSAAYLLISGAPLRVHVLSLAILFLAVLVSPLFCSEVKNRIKRLGLSFLCAVVCFLIWDSTAQIVIVKAEFLEIMKDRPWVYLVVGVILGAFIFSVAHLMLVLNHRLHLIAGKDGSG